MFDEFTVELNSPITEEQWDMLTDVDFDHTEHIWFHTKNGKEVHFYKDAIPVEWIEKKIKQINKAYSDIYSEQIRFMLDDWREENESNTNT